MTERIYAALYIVAIVFMAAVTMYVAVWFLEYLKAFTIFATLPLGEWET